MRHYSLYPIQCTLKETQLLREKADLQQAKFLMKKSIENFDNEFKFEAMRSANNPFYDKRNHVEYLIRSLDLYAQLLNETKSENPTVIIKELLEKSIHLAKEHELNLSSEKMSLISNSFYSLGKFADEKYQSICEHMKSTSFEEHTELMRQFQLERTRVSIVEPNSYFNLILHKQFEQDKAELRGLFALKMDYLCKSAEAYLYCLEFGTGGREVSVNHQNICVFRVVSLWTQNCQNEELNQIVKERIFKVATYKFYTLLHQLAARLSFSDKDSGKDTNSEGLFQSVLIELVVRIALDHPYHMLPIILQFSNSHKDQLINEKSSSTSSAKESGRSRLKETDSESEGSEKKFLLAEGRVRTANYIISLLKTKNDKIKMIIESMQIVCDAYIELANTIGLCLKFHYIYWHNIYYLTKKIYFLTKKRSKT